MQKLRELELHAPLEAVGYNFTDDLLQQAKSVLMSSVSPRTMVRYEYLAMRVVRWLKEHDCYQFPMSPRATALLASDVSATRHTVFVSYQTVINRLHEAMGFPSPMRDPIVQTVLEGMRRSNVTRKSDEIDAAKLKKILDVIPGNLNGLRDRCWILLAFTGIIGPWLISDLEIADVTISEESVILDFPRGRSRRVIVGPASDPRYCPVRATRDWLVRLSRDSGPFLMRLDHYGNIGSRKMQHESFAHILRKYCTEAGLKPKSFTVDSLRRGGLLELARSGVSRSTLLYASGLRSTESFPAPVAALLPEDRTLGHRRKYLRKR